MPCSSAWPMRSKGGSAAGGRSGWISCWAPVRTARKLRYGPNSWVGASVARRLARLRNNKDGSGRTTKGGFASSPRIVPGFSPPISDMGPRTEDQLDAGLFSGSHARPLDLALVNFLAQPLTVMPEAPAAGHSAPRHGADRATHPNCRIDMNNPDGNRQNRRRSMDNGRPALLLDRRLKAQELLKVAKPCLPQADAGDQQRADQHELRPEHELLARIVLADLGQILVVGGQHVANACHPYEVGELRQVLPEEPDEEAEEGDGKHQAQPGMQPAHDLAATEQSAQPVETRVEKG